MVDATSGVGLMNKSALEANELFEILYENSQQFNYRRDLPKKADAYEVSMNDYGTKIANLTNLVQQLIPRAQVCMVCTNHGHSSELCPILGGYMEKMTQENYMQQRNNSFSNPYNQGWRQYPHPPM